MRGVCVQKLPISARLGYPNPVAVTRHGRGAHQDVDFLSVTIRTREGKNAVIAIVGIEPKVATCLMADLMQRRLSRVEVIEITH